MNTKIIEGYIQFGIDNGFEFNLKILSEIPIEDLIKPREIYIEGKYYLDKPRLNINGTLMISVNIIKGDFVYKGYISIYETITSKEFIEAIARGYDKKLLRPAIAYTKEQRDKQIEDLINKITIEQAIAIRDGELEKFITNLEVL